jgi:hypothetical protein
MRFVLSIWCQVDGLTVPIWRFLTRGFSNPHFFVTETVSMNTSPCWYTWRRRRRKQLYIYIYIWAKGNSFSCRFPFLRQISNAVYRCSCGFNGFWELLTGCYPGSTFHSCLVHHIISTVISLLCRAAVYLFVTLVKKCSVIVINGYVLGDRRWLLFRRSNFTWISVSVLECLERESWWFACI